MAKKDKNTLTDQVELFCNEYIIDLNGKQAAIRAGYSPKTADQQASRLLSIVKVQGRIAELNQERFDRLEMTADESLLELMKWVKADFTQFMTLDTAAIQALPEELRQLITGFKPIKVKVEDSDIDGKPIYQTLIEFKFIDKDRALHQLLKHHGHYEAHNQQKASIIDLSKLSPEERLTIADLQIKAATE